MTKLHTEAAMHEAVQYIHEHAQVLRPDGTAIEGLYAAGNASASSMGETYLGAGGTIGPAMTFGYIAGRHAGGQHG